MTWIVFVHTSTVFGDIQRNSNLQNGIFYRRFRHTKYTIYNTPLEIVYVENVYRCSLACLANINCRAFHIDEGPPEGETRACELLQKDGAWAFWSYFTSATNYSYYDTHRKRYYQFVF